MNATIPKTLVAFSLTVYCRSIAAPMTGYRRFRREANLPPFRKLRSDYPLFFSLRNCSQQHRYAHIHRLSMSNSMAPPDIPSETATWVLGFHWCRKNHCLCPKHGLSSGYLRGFFSSDAGAIPWVPNGNNVHRRAPTARGFAVCTAILALWVLSRRSSRDR